MLLIDDYKQAIENASQAIQVNPKNANGYTMRSFAYLLSGNNKQASEDIKKIIKIGSEPGAYFLRSIIHVQMGNNKGAMEDLNNNTCPPPRMYLRGQRVQLPLLE